MNALMEILYFPLFTIAGVPTTLAEGLGFSSGALCVWLVARQHIANWPIGIANNLFFILLFAQAGLYADAGLQIVFIALAVVRLVDLGPRRRTRDTAAVRRTTAHRVGLAAAAGAVGRSRSRCSSPGPPTRPCPSGTPLTTALSLMATYGQCRKRVESWWLWIAADMVYIPLYAYKDLCLTSLLYVGFMALCVVGLRNWSRDLAARGARPLGAWPA